MSATRALRLSAMLLTITAALATAAHAEPVGGGWNPIENVSDPYIQELGRWAVAKHARRANDGLQFGRVTRGAMQIVGGVNYNLILDAADANGATAVYRAFVYEAVWTNTRKLRSFSVLN